MTDIRPGTEFDIYERLDRKSVRSATRVTAEKVTKTYVVVNGTKYRIKGLSGGTGTPQTTGPLSEIGGRRRRWLVPSDIVERGEIIDQVRSWFGHRYTTSQKDTDQIPIEVLRQIGALLGPFDEPK